MLLIISKILKIGRIGLWIIDQNCRNSLISIPLILYAICLYYRSDRGIINLALSVLTHSSLWKQNSIIAFSFILLSSFSCLVYSLRVGWFVISWWIYVKMSIRFRYKGICSIQVIFNLIISKSTCTMTSTAEIRCSF